MNEYSSLSEALYECFSKYIGTDQETKLHEDNFVSKEFKKFVGSNEYKKYDSYTEKLWKDAWREFDKRVFVKKEK